MMGMILVLVRGKATLLEYFSTVLAVDSIDAYASMHDIGARGPQPAAEPRPAAARFLCLGRPRAGRNFFIVAAAGCGPFVPAFVAYHT
jgi:hypothetical protein